MAVDVAAVCATAGEQGGQTLALTLSVTFSVYILVSIALSALTIYSSSHVDSTACTGAEK